MNKRVLTLLNTGKKEYDECGQVKNLAVCSLPISTEVNDGDVYNSIEAFLEYEMNKERRSSEIIYVEDLNNSSQFIINNLKQHGYKYIKDNSLKQAKDYTAVMSTGNTYHIKILVSEKPRRFINLYDISKVVPLNRKQINSGFGLNIMEYNVEDIYNEDNIKILLKNTIEYVTVMKYMIEMGLDGMTLSSKAFGKLKATIPGFNYMYKATSEDEYNFIHSSYDAGYNDINGLHTGKEMGEVMSLDVNSMFPSILRSNLLPMGAGVYYEGKGESTELYPLYIQKIRVDMAMLKDDKTAMVNPYTGAQKSTAKYIDEIDEPTELTLSNIMLELFLENYHVYDLEYLGGYKYSAKKESFKDFIDEWMGMKIAADKEGNIAIRTISKMVMNYSYGGFGKRKTRTTDYFSGDSIETEVVEVSNRYLPIAIFTTSYAIQELVTIRNEIGDDFIYADVDSIHIKGHNIPEILKDKVHQNKLGYWKIEGKFDKARFLKLKTYIEVSDSDITIRTAGAGDEVKEQMNFENFRYGNEFDGMIRTVRVDGGSYKESFKYKL